MMRQLLSSCAIIALLLSPSLTAAFLSSPLVGRTRLNTSFKRATSLNVFVGGSNASSTQGYQNESSDSVKNRLLDDFRTSFGEVVDPYKVLNVARDADIQKIKKSYWKLSKKYHPDRMRNRDILPGSCNNMEEVYQMWERVKFSYEILSDRTRRLRYDRSVFLADPKAGASRAAMDFVGWGIEGIGKGIGNGIKGVGKGMWKVGETAVRQATEAAMEKK